MTELEVDESGLISGINRDTEIPFSVLEQAEFNMMHSPPTSSVTGGSAATEGHFASIFRYERQYVPVQTVSGHSMRWIYLDNKKMKLLTEEQWKERRYD